MSRFELLMPPSGPLVPVEDLKEHVAVSGASQDGALARLEAGAVAWLDGYSGRLGRCILSQKWGARIDRCGAILSLPFPDCRDFQVERLSGSTWSPVAGASVQVGRDEVYVDGLPDDREGIYLTFKAGWVSVDHVPENLKQAVRMLVCFWFDHRSGADDGGVDVPPGVEALISPYIHVWA